MAILILIVVLFLAVPALFLGIGLGIGAFVHWLFPSVDLGMGIVVGLLVNWFSIWVVAKLFSNVKTDVAQEQEENTITESDMERIFHWIESPLPGRRKTRRPRKIN
jgi:membrane protein implicated in regulation of membrane protease activity